MDEWIKTNGGGEIFLGPMKVGEGTTFLLFNGVFIPLEEIDKMLRVLQALKKTVDVEYLDEA